MMQAFDKVFDEYSVAAGAVPPAVEVVSSPAAAEIPKESVLTINSDEKPRALFNGRQPQYTLKSERPEHRIVIMMTAAGMSTKEIAQSTGMTPQAVMYIKKQPWAVQQVLEEIEKAGREPVVQLLKTAAMDAAQRLIDIAENAENLETKRKANNDILDRVFGKPNQPVTNNVVVDPTKMTEAEIDQKLNELLSKRAS